MGLRIGLVAVIVLLGVGIGFLSFQTATISTSPVLVPNTGILYLAPTFLLPFDDTPGSFAALQAEGITVLHDFNDLKRLVAQSKPDAIILHQLSLPNVDKNWVASQYRDGVIIVAINVPMTQLIDWVDDPSLRDTPWSENWYKKPFYAYVGSKAGFWGGIRAGGNNNINDVEGNLQQFMFAIKLAIRFQITFYSGSNV
ncbi:MAG: hypothetical protein HZB51_23700 [Chloroflexi bacterium]|nr:hypothetical protein [Chloroflexota bacterium]